jgi:hypothetical protein
MQREVVERAIYDRPCYQIQAIVPQQPNRLTADMRAPHIAGLGEFELQTFAVGVTDQRICV